MSEGGILALWNDCIAGREADYERWYQGEHLAERLAVPGFIRGRRYEAVEARLMYFTYYEVETPAVLASPAYRERLDNPTPLTREMMSGTFHNLSRTICRVERRVGRFRGSHALAVSLPASEVPAADALLDALASEPGVARAELWTAADEFRAPASEEEKLRGGDATIAACLFVDALREADARAAADAARQSLGAAIEELGIYRFVCELAA